MNRLMQVCFLVATCAVAVGSSIPARADIPNLWWRSPEVIDSDVPSLPPSSGVSAVGALERWWVVYEKGGDVYCAVRDTSGGSWRITDLTPTAGIQTEPHIAANEYSVYVVWEERNGTHPEIWGRRAIGSGWDIPVCLSCDVTTSRHPVIDAAPGADPYVAWEDSTPTGFRVMGRRFNGTVQQISFSLSNAREPSVCDVYTGFTVAWTDDRNGVPQIYSRTEGQPERRVVTLPFPSHHPDVKNGTCGVDDPPPGPPAILFEGEPHANGITEVFAAHCNNQGADMISADDGISSTDPNIGSIDLTEWPCFQMPGDMTNYLATWTDHAPGGARHWMDQSWCCGTSPRGTDLLPATGISHSAIGIGPWDPHAGVIQLWIEDHAGVPTLMGRVGRTPGCEGAALSGPRVFLVIPGGTPPNVFRLYDACGSGPVFGDLGWYMDNALDAALTWDPHQGHSDYQMVNEQGEALFGVSAGGCSQAGNVRVYGCSLWPVGIDYPGAKSPDVDGNCEVDPGDLAYVESKVGTADFCADLDGSGIVDAADVAIVQATMWQRCSNVTAGVDKRGLSAGAPALRVFPNPCHDRATFETVAPVVGRAVRIEVIDAGGRRIRSIDAGADTRGSVGWDLRDEAGRAVPAGIYFVVARFGSESRREILVVY